MPPPRDILDEGIHSKCMDLRDRIGLKKIFSRSRSIKVAVVDLSFGDVALEHDEERRKLSKEALLNKER